MTIRSMTDSMLYNLLWLTSPHIYLLLPSLTLIHREKSIELGGAWRCAPAPTFLPPSTLETKVMCMAKKIFACVQMLMMQWGLLLLLYTVTQHHLTCSSPQSQDSGELNPFVFPLNPGRLNGICGKDRKDTNNQCSPPVLTVARAELTIQTLNLPALFSFRCNHITGLAGVVPVVMMWTILRLRLLNIRCENFWSAYLGTSTVAWVRVKLHESKSLKFAGC